MKDKNRGFIIYGVFPNEGGRERNTFRKFESLAKRTAEEWTAAGATNVRIVRTDQLAFCETCKRIVEFNAIERGSGKEAVKVKVCPLCQYEIHDDTV